MKKLKVNYGIIIAFLIIASLNSCSGMKLNHESKTADSIKIETVDVKLEDILTRPTKDYDSDIEQYYMNETPKTR